VNTSEATPSSAGDQNKAAVSSIGANDSLAVLGQSLREAREQSGLSIKALAGQLHMGEEQLHALESGDPEQLPELVFVIAQARRVAAALGIDATSLVAPLKQMSSRLKPAPAPLSASEPTSRQRPRARLSAQSYAQQTRPRNQRGTAVLRWLGSLALLAGLGAAGVWGWQKAPQMVSRQQPKATSPAKPVSAPAPVVPKAEPTPPPTDLTLSAAQPSWLTVRTAKGQVLFEGTFKGTHQFPLAAGLELLAGRPDLVVASRGEAKGKPLGRIDQIRWVSFSAPPR
jgi:cytoskeletal protein RodZ